MSAEQNKAIVSRWVAGGWNAGDLGLVDEFYADYTMHSPGMPDVQGTEAFKGFVTMYRTAFPDIHFTLESRHVRCKRECLLYPRKRHKVRIFGRALWVISGQTVPGHNPLCPLLLESGHYPNFLSGFGNTAWTTLPARSSSASLRRSSARLMSICFVEGSMDVRARA